MGHINYIAVKNLTSNFCFIVNFQNFVLWDLGNQLVNTSAMIESHSWPLHIFHPSGGRFYNWIPECQWECWKCHFHSGCVVRTTGGRRDGLHHLIHSAFPGSEFSNRSESFPLLTSLFCKFLRKYLVTTNMSLRYLQRRRCMP